MSFNFSGNEVIEMAIQIEKKGFDFYNILEKKAKRKSMKELFNWLATQEKNHITILEGLRKAFVQIDMSNHYNWEEVSLYFKALIDTQVFPDTAEGKILNDELDDEIGAIHIAISFEKDNILYFQEIREFVDEMEKTIINRLINEEKNHIMKLLEVKKQISGK